MPKRFPLQPLFDLAQSQLDDSAKILGLLKMQWQQADEKLQQLLSYREDYRIRLHNGVKQGMNATQMRDFQVFLRKLELAIKQQKDEVARCQALWEAGQRDWLEHRRKLKTYDTLSQRHHRTEAVREARLDQREQDEHARKSFASKEFNKEHDS